MATTMARRRWLAIIAAIAAVVMLVGFGMYHFDPFHQRVHKATNEDIGAGVDVTGPKVPPRLKATTLTPTPPITDASVVSLAPVVRVEPGGKLPAPMTMRFKLNVVPLVGTQVYIASRDKPTDDWQVQEAKLQHNKAPDGTTTGVYALVERDHLTDFWPFSFDIKGAFNSVKREVIAAITGDLAEQATQPKCADKAGFYNDDYDVEVSGKGALLYCVGVEKIDGKTQRIVRVTNARHYPLRVKHPGLNVPRDARYRGNYALEFQTLARAGTGRDSVIFPFDTLTYTLPNLKKGGSARISTDYDGWAQNLHRFDIALSAFTAIMAKMGGKKLSKKAGDRWKNADELLDDRDCAQAIVDGNTGGMLVKCFNPSKLKKLFDWKGILLSPLIAAGGLLNWIHSELTSLFDQFNSRSKFGMLIGRPDESIKFIGTWRVHGATLKINKGGTGTYSYNDGPCNYTHMCTAYLGVRWRLDGENMVYTVTSYKSVDETGQPPFDIGTAADVVGSTYTVRWVATGLLRVAAHDSRWQPSNPYLCDKGISGANQVKCGA